MHVARKILIIAGILHVLGTPVRAQPQIPTLEWPVAAPRITQDYGCFDCDPAIPGYHSGIDMTDAIQAGDCTKENIPVLSAADSGTVFRINTGCPNDSTHCGNGFGNYVIVEHQAPVGGSFFLTYAHLREVLVTSGQPIRNGQQLGFMGTSSVKGCHVHFDVLAFDPGHPGSFHSDELLHMGYDAYPDQYPSQSCNGTNGGCLDAKGYFARHPILIADGGDVDVHERPLEESAVVAKVRGGQVYVSIADSGVWRYIMLPYKTQDVHTLPDSNNAVFGWVNPLQSSLPQNGAEISVLGAETDGLGAPVLTAPGGNELTRIWGGHFFWADSVHASESSCSKPWYEIFVPPSRANGVERAWICGDYLVGNQCIPSLTGKSSCEPPPPQAPSVTTSGSSYVTQGSATLSLSVTPNGSDTSVWFDWDTGNNFRFGTNHQTIAASDGTTFLSMTLGGLTCDTTYYFRAHAQNAGGPATGDTLSFKTNACGADPQPVQLVADPSFEQGNNAWWVATPSFYISHGTNFPNPHTGSYYAALATSQGDPGNNLQGGVLSQQFTIPSNATSAELRFWYRISTSETTTTTAFDTLTFSLVKPGNQQTIVATFSNLDSTGTSYREKIVTVPSSFFGVPIQIFFVGTTDSSLPTVFRVDDVNLSAVVPPASGPPSVSTGSADQITSTSARLLMTVNPNGTSTTVWFDLEAGDSTPDNDTEHIQIGGGSQAESVSISVFGLECGTLYYFRANAQNGNVSVPEQGSVRSFTTSACSSGAPHADTNPAENITKTSATLTADVTPNGVPTQAWFAWGSSPNLGQETAQVSVGSGTGSIGFSQTISGLACGTTYYFESRAENSAGHDDGATLSFTTLSCNGGGPPAQDFSLDFQRQGCSGSGPAVLLWWTAPPGMSNVFTVRRADGGYTATVDSSQGGMAHLVSSSLVPGETYTFYVEGTLNGSPVQTNAVTVPILSDECRLPVGAGELSHLPLLWTGPPSCSGGTASVPIYWTAVDGATSYTLTHIDNIALQLTPYPNLTSTSFVDSGLVPGAEYQYKLDAVGTAGLRQTNLISVFVPSGICNEPSVPGPFSAQVSTPVCDAGKGAVTVSWTAASGAASKVRTYWSDDGLASGSASTSTLSSVYINGLRPGALVKFMVQAEAAATPRQYRSVLMSQRIPPDVCGGSTLSPTVTTIAASYIQEHQVLLRASIIPNGSTSSASFEWGTTTEYGSQTPPRNAGDGYRSVSLDEVITGLICNTTYHYRAVASNGNGSTQGTDFTFTTTPCFVNLIFTDGFESGDLSRWLTSGAVTVRVLVQGQPGQPGKDIWTTSYYSYTPVQGTPGGGLDDDRLRVGGWGDFYYSLIEFDLSGLPQHAKTARIELYSRPQEKATALYLDRITEFWDWRTQGTGSDRERLWWADRPNAAQWRSDTLPAPAGGQWYSIDITDLYNAWQAGTYPNYGIQLRPVSTDNAWAEFYSANAVDQTFRPRLVIEP